MIVWVSEHDEAQRLRGDLDRQLPEGAAVARPDSRGAAGHDAGVVARRSGTVCSASLTRRLLALGAFPSEAAADAAHVGIAAVNRVDYLLTWNLRHIAGAAARSRIEHACRKAGYEPPVICTPNEPMEEYDHGDKGDGPDHR